MKLNKRDARKIAETITTEQLKEMFDRAMENITDWEQISSVNKGMTIGATWNILIKCADTNSQLAKINMIREFGDYLDESVKPGKQIRVNIKRKIFHQQPDFKGE